MSFTFHRVGSQADKLSLYHVNTPCSPFRQNRPFHLFRHSDVHICVSEHTFEDTLFRMFLCNHGFACPASLSARKIQPALVRSASYHLQHLSLTVPSQKLVDAPSRLLMMIGSQGASRYAIDVTLYWSNDFSRSESRGARVRQSEALGSSGHVEKRLAQSEDMLTFLETVCLLQAKIRLFHFRELI